MTSIQMGHSNSLRALSSISGSSPSCHTHQSHQAHTAVADRRKVRGGRTGCGPGAARTRRGELIVLGRKDELGKDIMENGIGCEAI